MKKIILLLLVITLIILSCSEGVNETALPDNFSFQVNVTDADNNPLSGLTVSVWNKFPFLYYSNNNPNKPNKINAFTSIKFSIPTEAAVEIKLYDLDNKLCETLVSYDSLHVGIYNINYNFAHNFGTKVYKCWMIANGIGDSNNVTFEDFIYCVLISPEVEIAKIGETNISGSFKINKKLLFPNLYNLPELIRTNELEPDSLGTFTIPDSIRIALNDTMSGDVQYFDRVIKDGENIFDLVWGTGVQQNKALIVTPTLQDGFNKVMDDTTIIPTVPTKFRLYQNFPNPFN